MQVRGAGEDPERAEGPDGDSRHRSVTAREARRRAEQGRFARLT